MNRQEFEIYEDVMDACEKILAAIRPMNPTASMAGLVMCMCVLAHEDGQNKQSLISAISNRIDADWITFTRSHIEEGLRRLSKVSLRKRFLAN